MTSASKALSQRQKPNEDDPAPAIPAVSEERGRM